MNREEVTDLIVTQKIKKKLTWAQLAEVVGHSKEWSTAALNRPGFCRGSVA